MATSPARIVATTALSYSCMFATSRYLALPTDNARANLKAISSLHSILTTVVGLTALLGEWPLDTDSSLSLDNALRHRYLDDSQNPLIAGKSTLGNAVTSFETGYLVYDNIAIFLTTKRELSNGGHTTSMAALSHIVRNEPLLSIHHIGILTGLGFLQTYIGRGRERGIWIIVAFILMRASDPVLHWRWWMRKRTGKPDTRIDLLVAVVFAVCRFGILTWATKAYGSYHHLGALQALLRQRVLCQIGTGTMLGLNALWLGILLRNIGKRLLRSRRVR